MTWRQLRLEIARMPKEEQSRRARVLEPDHNVAECFEVERCEALNAVMGSEQPGGRREVVIRVGEKVLAPR